MRIIFAQSASIYTVVYCVLDYFQPVWLIELDLTLHVSNRILKNPLLLLTFIVDQNIFFPEVLEKAFRIEYQVTYFTA